MSAPVLAASHLDVDLGGRRILSEVSFTVDRREVVALLGANGSGKSTLVRAALGIIPIAAGSVDLFDTPLGARAPWHRIGYVPQRMPASTGVPTTALEVVRSGALSRTRLRRATRAQGLAALDLMDMSDHGDRPVQEMSGGQQQRVLIARALIREPELLVLDEPTTGIDLATTDVFVATIARMRAAGTSVIVVLHETEAFADLLDRAIVLRHGRVVHDGPPPVARGEHSEPGHVHTHHPKPEGRGRSRDLNVIGG